MSTFMQILVVGEVRSGVKEGRPWKMQEAQCMLLTESGEITEVGVYSLRRDEIEVMGPGVYAPKFTLAVGRGKDTKGQLVASIVGWTPVSKNATGYAPAAAVSEAADAVAKAAAKASTK